jgi:hypothetical protein
MSKKSKEKKRAERAKIKAAKKSANYLRCGPKAGHLGKRQTKRIRKILKVGPVTTSPFRLDRPSSKTRAKRRRFSPYRGKTGFRKLPLRPLRKRRHLGCPSREERGLT